jgi:crossover junction endodeoxyribonuclease RuvC
MEQYFVGIDPSLTACSVCVLDTNCNIIEQKLISTKCTQTIEERILYIYSKIEEVILDYPTCKIYIEGLSYSSNGQATLDLAGLSLFIRTSFLSNYINFTVTPPTTLKKFVTGSGKAKKEQMLLQTYKRWGVEFSDNNTCDAYCLSRLCLENNKENK